jgi:hypothetical protein
MKFLETNGRPFEAPGSPMEAFGMILKAIGNAPIAENSLGVTGGRE